MQLLLIIINGDSSSTAVPPLVAYLAVNYLGRDVTTRLVTALRLS